MKHFKRHLFMSPIRTSFIDSKAPPSIKMDIKEVLELDPRISKSEHNKIQKIKSEQSMYKTIL